MVGDLFKDPVFEVGDAVICHHANGGYRFTEGKEYIVLRYESRDGDITPGFTWPAYVHVLDDNGKPTVCHAARFTPKTST